MYRAAEVMYGYSGLGFAKSLAQTTSIQLAQAGADSAHFKEPVVSSIRAR